MALAVSLLKCSSTALRGVATVPLRPCLAPCRFQAAAHFHTYLRFCDQTTLLTQLYSNPNIRNSALWYDTPNLIWHLAKRFEGNTISEKEMAHYVRLSVAATFSEEPRWYHDFRANQLIQALKAASKTT